MASGRKEVAMHLLLIANLVTTSKALVTSSDALVPSKERRSEAPPSGRSQRVTRASLRTERSDAQVESNCRVAQCVERGSC